MLKNIWLRVKEVFRRHGTPSSPRKVIESVLGRGVEFFDYTNLDSEQQVVYYNDIQKVIHNESYQNEVKHLLADLIEEVAKSDADHNRDKILRYSINGLQVLQERLESIPDPRSVEPTQDNLNDVV